MKHMLSIFKRELRGYFATPVAYVFIVVFLVLAGVFTFQFGQLYGPEGQGQASLRAFFGWHPWLYLFFIPAVSMRLWAEERKTGTIELLMTLPITMSQAVLGKFLAAWFFTGIALLLTFPVWVTVTYLGEPDHGAIIAGYIGSLIMAGGFLAIGACISSLTKNQVIALVVTFVICLFFLLSGHPDSLDFLRGWAPGVLVDTISSFSFLTHFEALSKGVIDVRNLIFFFSLMAFFLFANGLILDQKKAD